MTISRIRSRNLEPGGDCNSCQTTNLNTRSFRRRAHLQSNESLNPGPLPVCFCSKPSHPRCTRRYGYQLDGWEYRSSFKKRSHPNLETAVGFLWIVSDYALRQKSRHPIAAPRINAAGITLGSLLLSASGFHVGHIDWNRIRAPLGYVPGAAVVGFQNELRRFGRHLTASRFSMARFCGAVLRHPYALSGLLCSYGVVELMKSALYAHDVGLVAISAPTDWGSCFCPCWTTDEQKESWTTHNSVRTQMLFCRSDC
jgi:hypothetical protein